MFTYHMTKRGELSVCKAVDQESLPKYEVLDSLLKDHIEGRAEVETLRKTYGDIADSIVRKVNVAEWKRRQYPIGPKLTTLSFGRERVVPITR